MVLNNIEQLIEKYDNAETTLQEEAQLKAYFTSNDVAPHLAHYKPLFLYFTESQQEQYTKDVPLKTKRSKRYQWISVAAAAVLMLGIIVPKAFGGPTAQEQQEAMAVYNKTMEALTLVSAGMNKGKQQLNSLALVSDNFNHGINEAGRLSEFSKTTNKILNNK